MFSRIFLIILIILICSFLGGVHSVRSANDCLSLLNGGCNTECHNPARICQKLGQKSEWQWRTTIKMMVNKKGAKLTQDEQISLRDCLTRVDDRVKSECDAYLNGVPSIFNTMPQKE